MRNKNTIIGIMLGTMLLSVFALSGNAKAEDDGTAQGRGMGLIKQVQMQADKVQSAKVESNESDSGEGDSDEGSTTDKLEARRAQRLAVIQILAKNQTNRSGMISDRLGAIIEKIESRIDKLKTEGVNTDAVEVLLDNAKQQKTDADEALEKATSDLDEIVAGPDLKKAVQAFMASMKIVRADLQELRQSLINVVKELRKISPKPDDADDEDSDEESSESDDSTEQSNQGEN